MAELRVSPRLEDDHFLLTVERVADLISIGFDETTGKGGMGEYVESHEFQPGDSRRNIDWRATALTGRLIARRYSADWCLSVMIAVDQSASMTLASENSSKYEKALHLAGGLAFAALRAMRPSTICGSEATSFPLPSLHRAALEAQLIALRKYRPGSTRALARLLEHGSPPWLGRSLAFVLTDLTREEDATALATLAEAHEVRVLVLEDGSEQGIEGAGYLRAREAEGERSTIIRGRMGAPVRGLDDSLRQSGISLLRIPHGASAVEEVRGWLEHFHQRQQ